MRLSHNIARRLGTIGVLVSLFVLLFGAPAHASPLSDCGYGRTQYFNNLSTPDGTKYNEFININYNYYCTAVSFPTAYPLTKPG